ncbi:MAG TPA: glycosyltransferase [Burkholderiales bacterium]|nr:glycosyltransferase [Burkholderiales bacterium]
MIEFVTVSHQPWRIGPLEKSLQAAMGPSRWPGPKKWRLTVIDGTSNDIFNGYNKAAASTTGDILAFMHHDIQVLANAVAFERPLRLLEEPATGLIGIAGATRLNAQGCWWGDLPLQEVMSHCRGIVAYPDENPMGMTYTTWPGGQGLFGQVVVVDGVFLMCHRRTLDSLGGFDSKTFKGFHFYDIDISFRAHLRGLKNYVAPLPLIHESRGNYDDAWESARKLFVDKFSGQLPCRI